MVIDAQFAEGNKRINNGRDLQETGVLCHEESILRFQELHSRKKGRTGRGEREREKENAREIFKYPLDHYECEERKPSVRELVVIFLGHFLSFSPLNLESELHLISNLLKSK